MSEQKTLGEELAELVANDDAISTDEATPESQPETPTEEAPAPSQEEPKVEEPKEDPKPEDPASEKEVPFHKHPRWIRMQQDLADQKKANEELAAKLSGDKEGKPVEVADVPLKFQKIFGEDVEAYKAWQDLSREEATRIIAEEKAAEKAQREKEETEKSSFVTWAAQEFETLSDETGIDMTSDQSTERNQILDICEKYSMFDRDGRPNFRKANELRATLYPQSTEVVDEKKRVVAKTNAKTNTVSTEPAAYTSKQLKKMSISQFLN